MSRMGTATSAPPAAATKVPLEMIAQRAYEKWVQRGRPHGDGIQDWLDAEKELKTEGTKAQQPPTNQRR